MEAQEGKLEGAGAAKVRQSPVASSVCEAMGLLFQALENAAVQEALENKIIAYFQKSTPVNAAKTCAKIMEYMVRLTFSALPSTCFV